MPGARIGIRGASDAATVSLSLLILSTLVCKAGGQAAVNSYFSPDTPPDGIVFHYTPGELFVFPPDGAVVEVLDDDLNGTDLGTLEPFMPTDGELVSAVDETFRKGPIALITRGAYIGDDRFYPGRPDSFRPTITDEDKHDLTKRFWACHEWGGYDSSEEALGTNCADQGITFHPENVKWTPVEDMNSKRFSNRTRFTYNFQEDEDVSYLWKAPNAARTICIQAGVSGGINPDLMSAGVVRTDHIRCWHIVFDLAPSFASCAPPLPNELMVDAATCGKRALQSGGTVQVAVGQTFTGFVYFEDLNRDLTENCTACDEVTINVLSNPGLPNGAQINETRGRFDIDYSADAPSRLVKIKTASTETQQAYYVYSRAISFTPTLADAMVVNPADPTKGIMYPICFQASSGILMSPVHCTNIQVILPDPSLVSAVQQRPLMGASLSFYRQTDHSPLTGGDNTVRVKCPYQWVIQTKDSQNDPGDIGKFDTPTNAGYKQGHYNAAVSPDPMYPLPMGAELVPHDSLNFVNSQILSWTPTRGMEGHNFSFCLRVGDAAIHTNSFLACTDVMVMKCEVCTEAGDTLHSVALDYQTDWLQLWGANPNVTAPNKLEQYKVLNLGPIFTTNRDENPSVLSSRFSMTMDGLASVNPDLRGKPMLESGTDVCIVPRICGAGGMEGTM
eukprot:CAMPEP_0181303768 /NCGR_PEP_ID=MMETSP1101-20121128/8747_1 /TAXON_ID=46948 /ORGANISM="Rhodomonas abbreviata, Strain Caron Lab Isolate" /LENGTH=673 /DNA_ID=CAMNT_0023409389 /DNA_START=80 /DNA_END=2101 /DNA_ORIENTATION=+